MMKWQTKWSIRAPHASIKVYISITVDVTYPVYLLVKLLSIDICILDISKEWPWTMIVDQRGWWFSAPDDSYMAQDYTECCKGYEESVEVIKKALVEQVRKKPFYKIRKWLLFICRVRKWPTALYVQGWKMTLVQGQSVHCQKMTFHNVRKWPLYIVTKWPL